MNQKVNITPVHDNNNNKLYLHDHNKVLQYCKSYLKLLIDSYWLIIDYYYYFFLKKFKPVIPKKLVVVVVVVVVVYKRFQLKWFDSENFCVFERWSIMEDGRLRDVVARGSATVT